MWRKFFRPSLFVGVVYLLLLLGFVFIKGYHVSDFIHLGTIWSEGNINGTWGYDGQFFYQIAKNPTGAAKYLDNAPFRYQRTLYPLAARLLSGGNLSLLPFTLLLVNWLSIVFGVEIVANLLIMHQLNPWFSLAYGLYFGQAVALTFDTTEPFTYLWICLGVFWFSKQRENLGALMMGIAAFSRETAVLFPLGYVVFFIFARKWKLASTFIILGILPLVIWLITLAAIFGKPGVTFTPPFETVPFYGIMFYAGTPRKFWLLLLLLLLPTALTGIIALKHFWQRRFHPLLFAWLANIFMIAMLSRYSYMELVSSSRVATGVVLAFVTYAAVSGSDRLLRISQIYTLTFPVYLALVWIGVDSLIM